MRMFPEAQICEYLVSSAGALGGGLGGVALLDEVSLEVGFEILNPGASPHHSPHSAVV